MVAVFDRLVGQAAVELAHAQNGGAVGGHGQAAAAGRAQLDGIAGGLAGEQVVEVDEAILAGDDDLLEGGHFLHFILDAHALAQLRGPLDNHGLARSGHAVNGALVGLHGADGLAPHLAELGGLHVHRAVGCVLTQRTAAEGEHARLPPARVVAAAYGGGEGVEHVDGALAGKGVDGLGAAVERGLEGQLFRQGRGRRLRAQIRQGRGGGHRRGRRRRAGRGAGAGRGRGRRAGRRLGRLLLFLFLNGLAAQLYVHAHAGGREVEIAVHLILRVILAGIGGGHFHAQRPDALIAAFGHAGVLALRVGQVHADDGGVIAVHHAHGGHVGGGGERKGQVRRHAGDGRVAREALHGLGHHAGRGDAHRSGYGETLALHAVLLAGIDREAAAVRILNGAGGFPQQHVAVGDHLAASLHVGGVVAVIDGIAQIVHDAQAHDGLGGLHGKDHLRGRGAVRRRGAEALDGVLLGDDHVFHAGKGAHERGLDRRNRAADAAAHAFPVGQADTGQQAAHHQQSDHDGQEHAAAAALRLSRLVVLVLFKIIAGPVH